ncbi:MAG: LytTR family transcriptional regulator [Clostridiales bacterium]|nr:LytTR family transcriptional regulator [Clostridiales bacterium]
MDRKIYLPIICRDLSQKIRISSILYLQQETRYVRIMTDHGEVVIRGQLADVAEGLPASFYECHSYLMVNCDRVEKMRDGSIFFDDGTCLPVGKGSYAAFRKRFNAYLRSLA